MRNHTFVIDYELHLKQGDNSEFSVEMRHMLTANVVALLGFSGFLARYAVQCGAFRRSAGMVHMVIWILTASMLLQYAGQLLHTVHLWRYRSDGAGAQTFDLISEVLFMMSQVIQVTLFIAIALGYTFRRSTIAELEVLKPIALAVSVVHAALVGLSKSRDGTSFKYHENEGAIGWLLLVIRLILYSWFITATEASRQKGGLQLQSFLRQFQVAGSMYFLAYPLIFVVVQVFAPYLQHPLMQTGLLAMQTTSHVWLARLFFSRGVYFEASVLSSSLLPGRKGALRP